MISEDEPSLTTCDRNRSMKNGMGDLASPTAAVKEINTYDRRFLDIFEMEFFTKVLENDSLDEYDRLLLTALGYKADEKGRCRLGRADLTRLMGGVCKKTVSRHSKKLEKMKLISIKRHFDKTTKQWRENTYWIRGYALSEHRGIPSQTPGVYPQSSYKDIRDISSEENCRVGASATDADFVERDKRWGCSADD